MLLMHDLQENKHFNKTHRRYFSLVWVINQLFNKYLIKQIFEEKNIRLPAWFGAVTWLTASLFLFDHFFLDRARLGITFTAWDKKHWSREGKQRSSHFASSALLLIACEAFHDEWKLRKVHHLIFYPRYLACQCWYWRYFDQPTGNSKKFLQPGAQWPVER